MDLSTVKSHLKTIHSIKGDLLFYDVHVHPFEVIDGGIKYKVSPVKGIYSSGGSEYITPKVSEIDFDKINKKQPSGHDMRLMKKVFQLNRRRIYSHTGPKVFYDQMKLAGIDKSVLLPVMAINEYGDHQLSMLSEMYRDHNRFLHGYCIPNDIPDEQISSKVKAVADRWNIRVLKIHPSLQGINLSKAVGRGRLESILAASKESKLKVVIHGGLSPECKDPHATDYGALKNLQKIDWSITPETVFIAHSGAFGYRAQDVDKEVLPTMSKLLSRYENLAIDTSGLEIDSLSLIFRTIDARRIFFGSDALYENQWTSLLKAWCALLQSVKSPEESLIQIVSKNPHTLFSVETIKSREAADQVTSGF